MKISDREIGPGSPTFIVCELSGSHLGKLDNAHRLIDYAASAGADSVKLQTYEPSDFTTPETPALVDGPWRGERPWDLYTRSQTPRVWHAELFDHAHERGLVAFSTPYSPDAVEFLETLDCPAYKVASLETGYTPLLEAIRRTGKPVLVSTGASGGNVRLAFYQESFVPWSSRSVGIDLRYPVVVMHCVASYPTPIDRANLMRLRDLGNLSRDDAKGLSDHSRGFLVPVLAVALGACVIEKHIKLYEDDIDGPDAAFAETPYSFKLMVEHVRMAEEALAARDNSDIEAPMRALRRREIDGQWLRCGS